MIRIIPNLGNVHDEVLFMICIAAACVFTTITIIYGGIKDND